MQKNSEQNTVTKPSKSFEGEVRVGLKRTFPTYMVYHEADFPIYLIKQSNIRFKQPQAVDFLILGRAMNFAIEVKYTQSAYFPFSNIRGTQLSFLTSFQEKAGESFLVIGTEYPQLNANLISLSDFNSLRETIGKEGINFKNDLGAFGHFFTGLPRIQLKTKYYIDFNYLRLKFKLD